MLGGTLMLGLSVLPPSTTRLDVWPWAGFAALLWLFPVVVALCRLALGHPHSRFGGLIDTGMGLLAVSAAVSALASPVRGVVLPHLLPLFGICALPYALLPLLQPSTRRNGERIVGALLILILGASLLLWWQPWLKLGIPASRNDQPFGHANITGSVSVLAATWLTVCALREQTRAMRLLFAAGTILAVSTALSSGSRGSVLALAAAGATAAAILLLRRGRFLVAALVALLIAGVIISANTRLRELVVHGRWHSSVRESNDQRTAMILGGLRLGSERPLLGWGPGSIPHVFPQVRADLPGTADNFLQLHNTPVQLWATLGTAGLLAALLVAIGVISRLRAVVWTSDRVALAAGLCGAATALLFDHPFATPAFSLLAALHLADWSRPNPAPVHTAPANLRRLPAVLGVLLLLPVLYAAGRDLAARREFDDALANLGDNDHNGYVAGLRRAASLAPSDAYYAHLLAAHLATGHPFPDTRDASPEEAVILLRETLSANPDLEYAHYNLGWLLLGTEPQTSARHFREAARLAPQRGSVYLGLGLARIRLNDTAGAVRAFATEWLLDPDAAWSPVWSQPPLDALRSRIHAEALKTALPRNGGTDPWSSLAATIPAGVPYRRVRTGYGVLMGHPEGAPPVDFPVLIRADLPSDLRAQLPAFGWLDGGTLLHFLDAPTP